ncbi:hypothetical protein [Prevotella communis]|nr:hypothetical protein [Prevotella communis]
MRTKPVSEVTPQGNRIPILDPQSLGFPSGPKWLKDDASWWDALYPKKNL